MENSEQKEKGKKNFQFSINLKNTQYNILKIVAKELNMIIDKNGNESDLFWTDHPLNYEVFQKLKSYQRINWIQGIEQISKKNNLAKNMQILGKRFPEYYNFFPKCWSLPVDSGELKQYIAQEKKKTFIVKPDNQSQGKGIILIQKLKEDHLKDLKNVVIQEYIAKPYLINKLKFDLRIYALIVSTDPLRIYMYQEGLARFATQKYVKPNKSNLENSFQHLTNYAINKQNPDFIFNIDENVTNIGHKQSFTQVLNQLQEKGHDIKKLIDQIKIIILRTILSIQPYLTINKLPSNNDIQNSQNFHIVGFDILLDHKLKPWLLEVNQNPSLTADTPFDVSLKKQLIIDTLILLNVFEDKAKRQYYSEKKDIIFHRQKKKDKLDELQRNDTILTKQLYETQHLGNYQVVIDDFTNIGFQQIQQFVYQLNDQRIYGKQIKFKLDFNNKQYKSNNELIVNQQYQEPQEEQSDKRQELSEIVKLPYRIDQNDYKQYMICNDYIKNQNDIQTSKSFVKKVELRYAENSQNNKQLPNLNFKQMINESKQDQIQYINQHLKQSKSERNSNLQCQSLNIKTNIQKNNIQKTITFPDQPNNSLEIIHNLQNKNILMNRKYHNLMLLKLKKKSIQH